MSKRRALPSKMDKDGFGTTPAPKSEPPKVKETSKATAPPKAKQVEAKQSTREAERSKPAPPTKDATAIPDPIETLRANLTLAKTQGNKTLTKTLKKALHDLERDKRERISLSLPESKIEELRNLHALQEGPATLSSVVEEAIDWLLKKGRKAHGGEIPTRPDAGKPLARGPRGQR